MDDSICLGRVRRLVPSAALVLAGACVTGDSLTNPPPNDGKNTTIPWDLMLNYRAINIVAGDEVQLAVTPLDVDRLPIDASGLPPVEYTVSDTTVTIDASGRLTAAEPRASVLVVAKMQSLEGNWTIDDSARVRVLDGRYAFSGFEMRPQGPSVQPSNRSLRFDAVVTDAAGQTVLDAAGDPIMPMTYYSVNVPRSEYRVSNQWNALGFATNITTPTITGTSYIFGDVYTDSLTVKVAHPDSAVLGLYRLTNDIDPSPTAMPQKNITVLRDGKVTFRQFNVTSPGDDIVFEDLDNVMDGDIPEVSPNPGSIVTFPNVGSFTYRSTTMDVQGTITVVDPPTP